MNFDAWHGSVWFALVLAAAGYIAGHLFPISKLKGLIKRG